MKHCQVCGTLWDVRKCHTDYGQFNLCPKCDEALECYNYNLDGLLREKVLQALQILDISYKHSPKECAVCRNRDDADIFNTCDICGAHVCPITCCTSFEDKNAIHILLTPEIRAALPTNIRKFHTITLCTPCTNATYAKMLKDPTNAPIILATNQDNTELHDLAIKRIEGKELFDLPLTPPTIPCIELSLHHITTYDRDLLNTETTTAKSSTDINGEEQGEFITPNPLSILRGPFGFLIYVSSGMSYVSSGMSDFDEFTSIERELADFGYSINLIAIIENFWNQLCTQTPKGPFKGYIRIDIAAPIISTLPTFK